MSDDYEQQPHVENWSMPITRRKQVVLMKLDALEQQNALNVSDSFRVFENQKRDN